MTQPNPDRIGAAIDALRAEAEVWNDIHERLNRCATHVRTLPITDYADVAFFASFLSAYNDVVERYAARCTEGAAQTFSVGLALASVADVFAAAEEANLHHLHTIAGSEDRHGAPSR